MAEICPEAVRQVCDMFVLKFLLEGGHDKVARKFSSMRQVPDVAGLHHLRLEDLLDFVTEVTSEQNTSKKVCFLVLLDYY